MGNSARFVIPNGRLFFCSLSLPYGVGGLGRMRHIESIITLIRHAKDRAQEDLANSEKESPGRRAYLHGIVDGIDECLATVLQFNYLEQLKNNE